MNSHAYAAALKEQAAYLLSKPDFPLPSYRTGKEEFWYMWDKEPFLLAVQALGSGKKVMSADYVEFHPTSAPISLKVDRTKICTLVKPAEYDCTPLLSQIEEMSLSERESA